MLGRLKGLYFLYRAPHLCFGLCVRARIRANWANQERLVTISRVLLYTNDYIQSVG